MKLLLVAGLSCVSAPQINLQLQEQGFSKQEADALTQLAALGMGAAVGGAEGAVGGYNEATNNAVQALIPIIGGVSARACLASSACVNAIGVTATTLLMQAFAEQEPVQGLGGFGEGVEAPTGSVTVFPIADNPTDNLLGNPEQTDLSGAWSTTYPSAEGMEGLDNTSGGYQGLDQGETGGWNLYSEDARNRAQHEIYKDDLITEMEKPTVYDQNLQRIVDQLYRPNATIGSGSTAAAVREEMSTGEPVGNRFHTQKALDKINELNRWLNINQAASPNDRAATENLIKDMQNALRGK